MCADRRQVQDAESGDQSKETQGGFVISRQVRRRSLCALVALGLVLAACSSDDGDDADETTTLAPEPTDTPTTDTEVPVDTGLTGDGLAVGVLAPSPGLLTVLFQGQQRGIDFAVEDIADGGGVLGGPLDATTTAAPLDGTEADLVPTAVEDGAQALIGPTGSSGALEYRDAVQNADSISCSPSASVPGLTADQETFGLFRTALPDDVTVGYLTDMVMDRRDEQAPGAAWNVAIVARNDDYGLAIGNGLAYALQSHGLVPTVVDYNAHRVNFTGTASEVTDLQPDLTVIVSYEEGAPIVTELVRGGVDPAAMIGLESFFRPRIATLSAPDGNTELVNGFTMVGTTGDLAFLERLYEADPNGQIANAAQAYDCTIVLALANEAVADGSSDSVSAAVRDVTADGTTCTTYADCLTKLQAGENIDYDGASGRIAIDEHGDPTFGRFTTATIQDGEVGNIETSDIDVAELRREQAAFAAAAFNTKLQQALTFLGFYTGPIDGLESPELTAALAAFQASVGLPPTGVYDAATDAALRAALGEFSDLFNSSTRDLQVLLTDLGFYSGPIDGIWSPELTEAVRALQRELGVPETGVIDAATVQAIYERGIATGSTTTVPDTPDTTAAPETTAAPTTAAPPTAPPPTAAPDTTAPPTTEPPAPEEPNLFATLQADPDFSIFLELVLQSGFDSDVERPSLYTVFAPTNEAFEDDPETLAQLRQLGTEDPGALAEYLSYYIAEGSFTTSTMPAEVRNLYGDLLTITGTAPNLSVNDVLIDPAKRDIAASNGVIQGLEALIATPSADDAAIVPEPPVETEPPVEDEAPVATEPAG